MAVTKRKAILFLDSNQIYFYGSNLTNPVAVEIPKTVVSDIELLDRNQLLSLIGLFIDNNKVEPVELLIILTPNMYFEKQAAKNPSNTFAATMELKDFLDNVPFNTVLSKIYEQPNAQLAIATNDDLLQAIRTAFELKHFTLDSIVPLHALPMAGIQITAIDIPTLDLLLSKFEKLKQTVFNMYQKPQSLTLAAVPEERSLTSEPVPPKNNKRVYILSGVFAFLLIVLGAVIIMSLSQNTPTPTAPPQPIQNATIPTISPIITPSESSEVATNSSIIIPSQEPTKTIKNNPLTTP